MKKRNLRFILSMTIILSLLLFRPINFDQGHEDVHKNLVPPKPGTYTEGNYVDGSIKETKVSQDGNHSNTSPQLSLSQDEIDKINDGKAEKVLVIPVQFSDEKFDDGINEGDEAHDKAHFIGIMEQMKLYYELNSGYVPNSSGITIDYYVTESLELDAPFSMSYFGADGVDIDDLNGPVYELTRQAVLKLDAEDLSFDFSEYDTDGDNVIDHLIIIHAGIGQEEDSITTDLIWSHQWYIGGTTDYTDGQEVDGVYAHNYTTMPETGKLGVFAHEFGHDLGLPDLYDTNDFDNGLSEGAGVWGLMAGGNWNCLPGNEVGTSPSNLSAWSRAFLGWEVPTDISSDKLAQSVTNTNGISSIIKVFPKGNQLSDQHYLVEYRKQTGYDSALPGEGVLIWHIDDYVIDYVVDDNGSLLDYNAINIFSGTPGVVFEHADGDGNPSIITSSYFGDSGDPFSGSSNNYNFTYMPYGLNMDDRNHEYTYVEILDIETIGDNATFDIYVEENAPIKPTVVAPIEGNITTEMPTFTWNIVPQAQEYIIQIASDGEFGTVLFEISLNHIQADVNGRYSYTLDEPSSGYLKDGSPLYWRTSAVNATNVGDTSNYVWSDANQFTIPAKLNTPNNLSTTEFILGELEITWDPVIGADGYYLDVDGQIMYGTTTTYNHTNLAPSSTHTYRVMAVSPDNLSSWSEPYGITTQDEATISLDCSGVTEGNEDGSIINVEISSKDGEFISSLSKDDINISGLPEGITVSGVTLNGTTSASITLSGNSTVDYDLNQEVVVTLTKDKFIPQQINTITDSDDIVATIEPIPNAPTGITFSLFGTDANKLMNTDTSMEYSIDGGSTYIDITEVDMQLTTQLSNLSVEDDILVRYKEILRESASYDMVIDLLPSSISTSFSTAVVEGSEDGSEILIEIQDDNGRFVEGLTVDDINLSDLPLGISKNNITINSITSVAISLTGNSTVDYDETQEIIVSIAKDKFIPQQINDLTNSAIMVATNEPIPDTPSGITFTFDGDDANKLIGTDTRMEFSIDGGITYIEITESDFEIAPEYLNDLSGESDIRVRLKATLRDPASLDQRIDLETNSNIPAVTHDDNANTITGMTTEMEFSSNGGLTWVKYVDESSLPDLSNNITILVRYYRFGTTVHSQSVTLKFNKPAPPPMIIMPPPLPAPEPIVDGVEIPITVIGESSSEEQIIVRISSEDKDKPIVFTEDLLNQVNNVNKDIVIEKEDLSFTLPPGAIDSSLFEDVDAVFTIDMDQIPPQDVQDKLDKAEQNDGNGLFAINGLVFEFEAQVVTEESTTPVTEFEQDVTITISLDSISISDNDVDKLGIYWFNEATQEWEYMGGQYDPETNTITFTTGHFSTYSVFKFEKTFKDIQNHWAKNEIEQLASMRIIKGKSDNIFDPNATITRAEFTALIVRTIGLSVDDYSVETPFEDVINDKWYYEEIGIAYNAGLLPTKYTNGYGPDTPISREDMAIIMSNALQLKNGFITMDNTDIQSILEGYSDVDVLDSEAIKAVAIAVNEGLIQGRTLSTIVPEGNLMRAEAAVVIKRLLGIIE